MQTCGHVTDVKNYKAVVSSFKEYKSYENNELSVIPYYIISGNDLKNDFVNVA